MASHALDRLREALTAMPAGTLVPRDWVLERLSEDISNGETAGSATSAASVDLTIRELARLFGKHPSTVRAWVERGDFPGAYKLFGKQWRVPGAAVTAFQNNQRRLVRGDSEISAWRAVRRRQDIARPESGQQHVIKRRLGGKSKGVADA